MSPLISEPIRALAFFVAGAPLVVFTFLYFSQLFDPPRSGTFALVLLIMLYVPQFSPVFCFFRPTIRQFPKLKNELRLLSGTSEIAKTYHMGLYGIMFFGVISMTFKELGAQATVWRFIIIAPFFWMAVLQSNWRDSRWLRAERLTQKVAPRAPREMRNVGSWSNKFAHTYLFDVCFVLSMILAQILIQ